MSDSLTDSAAAPIVELLSVSSGGTAADIANIFFVDPTATATLEVARARMRNIEQSEHRLLASRFVERLEERARANPYDRLGIEQVWLSWEPSLDVIVVVRERNLDTDLQLRALFREVAATTQDPAGGDLTIVLAPFAPEGAELVYER